MRLKVALVTGAPPARAVDRADHALMSISARPLSRSQTRRR